MQSHIYTDSTATRCIPGSTAITILIPVPLQASGISDHQGYATQSKHQVVSEPQNVIMDHCCLQNACFLMQWMEVALD